MDLVIVLLAAYQRSLSSISLFARSSMSSALQHDLPDESYLLPIHEVMTLPIVHVFRLLPTLVESSRLSTTDRALIDRKIVSALHL